MINPPGAVVLKESPSTVDSPFIRHRRHDPLFVIGHGRSGTSVLSALIRKYLRIAFGTESQFVVRYYRGLSQYGDLTSETNRWLLVHDLSRERFFQRSRKYGLQLDMARVVNEANPQTYAGALQAIFRQVAESQRMERWGDKTPEYSHHLPVLRELFPSAQYIHIVRDGRDVALSGYLTHFGPKNAYTAASEWSDVLDKVHCFAATMPASSFIEVRYEDLLLRTHEVFNRLIRFLEVDDPDGAASDAVARLASRDIHPGNFNKWKTSLTTREQDMFSAIAGRWLKAYGYEMTPAKRPAPNRIGRAYWKLDNSLRRMKMREYWLDTSYKARLRLHRYLLPVRFWRSAFLGDQAKISSQR